MERLNICVVLEGSYPFITGGVSSWVHQLIQNLPQFDFSLYTISPKADQEARYPRLDNVIAHQDIVLSEKHRSKGRVDQARLHAEIEQIHQRFASGAVPAIDDLVKMIPQGHYLYSAGASHPKAWQMVVTANQKSNPVYPFSDYFWAWQTAHNLMFTMLGVEPPKADLYHAISTGYAGLAAAVARIKNHKPLILTEHGLYHKEREMEIMRSKFFRGYQRDMWTKVYNSLSRLTYRYSDTIVALFEYNRRKQIDLGAPTDRTIVIPNGIDLERFQAIEREDREGFHVGLVGRVVPIKDIKTFILACKVVSSRVPKARFYCIGPTDEDPAYYEDCKLLVRSFKLEEKFEFTGLQDVRDYYAFLDVLLLTSVREAQPLVILEAYAAGVPVVSTRVGNVGELLDYDERFLASSKDAEKIAEGVVYLHDHPEEVKDLVARNRQKVQRFYDRRTVYATYGKLYEDTVAAWQE